MERAFGKKNRSEEKELLYISTPTVCRFLGMDVYVWQLPPSPFFSHILLLLAQSISSPSFCSLSINKSPLIPCNVGLTLTLSLRISSPSVCRHVTVSVLICLQSPDSLIALLVYLQISQFAPLPSIWHRPPMSQWSDKTTDVFAFCSGASL